MKRQLLGALALSVLLGCSFRAPAAAPTDVPSPTTITEMSSWVPASIPLLPVLDPNDSGDLFKAPEPIMTLLSSRAEMNAFIEKFPTTLPPFTPVVPPGMPVPSPVAQPVIWPESVTAFDFDRYQAVAFAAVGANTATARIVGIEEQPNRWVVHTVQWNRTVPHHQNSHLHIVGIPKSTKPVVFAATLQKTLASQPVYPSPQVGVLDQRPIIEETLDTQARWKAIPSPELTEEKVAELVRARFKTSAIASLTVEKQTLQWIHDTLGEGIPWPLLPESEVWIVHVKGDVNTDSLPGGAEARFSAARLFLTIDTGYLLSFVGAP